MANVFGLETRTSSEEELALTKTPSLTKKKLLLAEKSQEVIGKILNIALNDEHPKQDIFLKWAGDRMLPMAEFEKKSSGSRTAVTITISGIGESNIVDGKPEDVEEV
jgi:hypothetical protein